MHRVLLCQTMSPADGLAAYAIAGNIRRPNLAARMQTRIDFAISQRPVALAVTGCNDKKTEVWCLKKTTTTVSQ